MILKHILLYPSLDEFHHRNEERYLIQCQTKFITNYLGKKLQELKFETKDFTQICLIAYEKEWQEPYVNSSKSLSAAVKFNINECLEKPKAQLPDYYINLISDGLNKLPKEFIVPRKELLNWLKDFKNGEYINKWIFKERTFREFGIKCRLDCELTIDEFKLTLVVIKNGIEILKKVACTKSPDDVVYTYFLNDVIIKDGKILVIDKFKKAFLKVAIPADN
jgi:hypothetical protein